ncbi:Oidioi.mRNA.OKI2018_I69.XSR.g14654.t1.cds [Oikopleura dioica]|uniref:Oidioi.mRNA.OKI2018_I69.XSR.g14654.t1.cds n=1 Tax=Oikopleura dioica TaxID=34765 RepID=A0ABN7SJE3_OIKDI|nr:Oidioi.mRNA.OKI2018_I69.XSR.g14654.t1.cds [Oikopleura dioica]
MMANDKCGASLCTQCYNRIHMDGQSHEGCKWLLGLKYCCQKHLRSFIGIFNSRQDECLPLETLMKKTPNFNPEASSRIPDEVLDERISEVMESSPHEETCFETSVRSSWYSDNLIRFLWLSFIVVSCLTLFISYVIFKRRHNNVLSSSRRSLEANYPGSCPSPRRAIIPSTVIGTQICLQASDSQDPLLPSERKTYQDNPSTK